MRISWLTAEEIASARDALTANGTNYDDHFTPAFTPPPAPAGSPSLDWPGVTEHVARAERVSAWVRDTGLEGARARFAGSQIAIETATLAAAAHEIDALGFDEVAGVLGCAIDGYVFYAPFLELLAALGKDDLDRTVQVYEAFVAAYTAALHEPGSRARVSAVRDGLADFYVSAGRLDQAEALFERRHEEDRGDVAVALSASRAFLAAGSTGRAVRWLGLGAGRAQTLGRQELANRLLSKQAKVRERLS
jgi:tetratricopeptide (TPR) repeat protein